MALEAIAPAMPAPIVWVSMVAGRIVLLGGGF
jgi:hypothetical protein